MWVINIVSGNTFINAANIRDTYIVKNNLPHQLSIFFKGIDSRNKAIKPKFPSFKNFIRGSGSLDNEQSHNLDEIIKEVSKELESS